tara:strand:+ start:295 stop:1398 length:1104 start_codon:yes stop_codon:yes gene_type:complete
MTYKETLFFIGQSLTINHSTENKIAIEKLLKENSVDWDAVVKVSTGHFVFPALYCNLKRANFLHYLPEELVNYMVHITDLNRERNQKIIDQAKEINELLLANNITPIFLKGTGNLLEGLYEDIAERMVGDIDFIVSKEEYTNTIKILYEDNYKNLYDNKNPFPHTRHYTRIIKKNRIAALEIHTELTSEKYFKRFGYEFIKKDLLKNTENETFISYDNQLCLSIISTHINDNGFLFKRISLKNSYDVFLLSLKVNTLKAVTSLKFLSFKLNSYLATSYYALGKPKSILWIKNSRTKKYLYNFFKYLDKKPKLKFKLLNLFLFLKLRISIIKKVFIKKEMRKWFFELINSKKWQNEKMIQLGIKKRIT